MPASAASFNTTLTNYAQGFSQDRASSLASFIAPVVATGVAHSQFKRYSDKNSFQIYDTNRAIGGDRRRIEFAADDPFFNCSPQGLEVAIDDHEREMAGANQTNLEQGKLRTVVDASHLSHEKKVFDAVKAAKAATGGIGVWSSASNDPIDDIDSQIEAIAVATGIMPNRIVVGLGAWRVLKNHPKVQSRQPGSSLVTLNEGILGGMLLNPSIEVRVGVMSYDTTKFGNAKNASEIVGGEVFVFIGTDTPTQYDPSFAKTFSVDGSLIGAVKEYRSERNASDIYAVDWSEDIQVVAAAAGRRITLS
jgi:hypothetical protein